MPIVKQKTKNILEDVLRVGVGSALIGIGSVPSGVLGAIGSIATGYIGKEWIVKGTLGDILFGFSVINAVDLLMEGMTPRGVFG